MVSAFDEDCQHELRINLCFLKDYISLSVDVNVNVANDLKYNIKSI
jgi:hypothetical protein